MPGIDLNPVCKNLKQLLKTDLAQPTPTHPGRVGGPTHRRLTGLCTQSRCGASREARAAEARRTGISDLCTQSRCGASLREPAVPLPILSTKRFTL